MAEQTAGQTTSSNQATGKHVLCIEDEHFITELYVRALTKAGYQVAVEFDGAKGLQAAQTNAYDIILLDLMLPTMTGMEVLKRLRNPKETPELKARVIITTNLGQDEETREAIERQADGYIIKAEITPKQLVGILGGIE
jgi:DNA-binding response OmpR family regulator